MLRISLRLRPATAQSSTCGSTASNIRPYANTVLIRVGRGYLRAGDTLTIRLGDRRQGSPGLRLQTNVEKNVRSANLDRRFCHLRILSVAGAADNRSGAGTRGQMESDLCPRLRLSASHSGSPSSPRTCGAIRPRMRPAPCSLHPRARCAGCPTASPSRKATARG